mmetsp:Transcript_28362/g.41688  ORF Transcript_28362/g.41688 Transcript_28362/m.41688 type:complete len:307 (-) Transcript_28362:102-1022(-)
MALIQAYEDQYQTLIKDVNAKIDRLKNLSSSAATDSEAWAGTAAAVQRDVEDAEEVLGKFTMEARSIKGDLKASMQAKVKQYKIDVGVCKESVDGLTRKRKEASERKDLLEGSSSGSAAGFRGELTVSNEHRSRLTTATDRMASGSDRLKESRKIARDTEMVAVDIMEDLRQQRETLLHARDSANEVSENLAESRKFVKMIQRRVAQNKLFMYGVLGMVVMITITLVFLQLSPSSSTSDPSSPQPSSSPPAATPLPPTRSTTPTAANKRAAEQSTETRDGKKTGGNRRNLSAQLRFDRHDPASRQR